MSGHLGQTSDVRVHVEAHGRPGVSEPAGELDGLHPALVPEGGAAVSEAVGTESGASHLVTDPVAVADAEREAVLEGFKQELGGINRPPDPLALAALSRHANAASLGVYVAGLKRQGFRHSASELLHNDDGKTVGTWDVFENAEHVVTIRWDGFSRHVSWKLHPAVAGDVDGDVGEVEHHTELGDEQADGAGFVAVEAADPLAYVTDADLVDGSVAEGVEEYASAVRVTVKRALGNAAATSKPLGVRIAEQAATDLRPFHFYLRIEPASKPLTDDFLSYEGFISGSKAAAMLDLAVSAAAAVANVEAPTVPGVPGADVEGCQSDARDRLDYVWQSCFGYPVFGRQ